MSLASPFLLALDPFGQVLVATLANWGWTAVGAATIFLFREVKRPVFDGMLGFAAGIMLAACFWSLLGPALAMSGLLPPLAGFFLGAGFLMGIDRLMPHLHLAFPPDRAEGPRTSWQRSLLMTVAITIHNIPEGLAVGVAFGAANTGTAQVPLAAAMALALGIGIQNVPEGAAISFLLRREGLSVWKSFHWGQLSGIVEPLGGILAWLLISLSKPLLPYALGFAAGAMLFVIFEEVIPESQQGGNTDLATLCFLGGFALMMVLDGVLR